MKTLNIEKVLGILMLVFAVGFNLWIYRLEPTAKVDPNDNAFQFALVDRTNTMWDFAYKKCAAGFITKIPIIGPLSLVSCHLSLLSDHWVPNWAVGYNLPYYYSHIPQIMIVATWRLLSPFLSLVSSPLSLFQYYHIVIYLLMCFFPVSVFLALRVMRLSWLTAGIGAIFALNLSTDGLYGLDPSSFLWRGYGLSSQLFAMTWFPLAIAYAYRYFAGNKSLVSSPLSLAVTFVTATTAGHLGIGMMAMMSLGFLAVAQPIMSLLNFQFSVFRLQLQRNLVKLLLVSGLAILLLSYWIIPVFTGGNFHNISFWDPVWKFNSYGVKEIMIRLFDGKLFDFGRLPVITYLALLGILVGLMGNKKHETSNKQTSDVSLVSYDLSPLSFLFIFWLVFYFGRTTWGGLIDLIPGMKDFHLSRFIVGLHMAGMFLAPIGLTWLAESIQTTINRYTKYHIPNFVLAVILVTLVSIPIFRWTLTYNELNDRLIIQANNNYAKVRGDEQKLFATLRSLPGARIFAGRGGGYGKRFQVAETPYYMHLSTYGLPTTLWLPETWSMNSDTEQYFSENQQKDYDLYNIRWIAAPADGEPVEPQPFWKQIDEVSTWKLYEATTSGYFTTGARAATVAITKMNFVNVVHLWIQSDNHAKGIFPELTFDSGYPKNYGLPNFKMTDEVTYVTPDGKTHNLFNEPPVYLSNLNNIRDVISTGQESNDTDMIFSTTVEVKKDCKECLVILKQTYHPNWRATVNGKPVTPIIVFPFYPAVQIEKPGTYTVTFTYTPSPIKTILLCLAIGAILGFLGIQLTSLRKK